VTWLAPILAFFLVPKCGLCVLAWVGAVAGLSFAACGSSPSWMFLFSECARQFGWTAAVLAAASPLALALGAMAVCCLGRGRATRLARER